MKDIERKRREDDRKELMKLPAFRRHLFEILDASAMTKTTREAQQSLQLEGKRALGLDILGWYTPTNGDVIDVIALANSAQKQP